MGIQQFLLNFIKVEWWICINNGVDEWEILLIQYARTTSWPGKWIIGLCIKTMKMEDLENSRLATSSEVCNLRYCPMVLISPCNDLGTKIRKQKRHHGQMWQSQCYWSFFTLLWYFFDNQIHPNTALWINHTTLFNAKHCSLVTSPLWGCCYIGGQTIDRWSNKSCCSLSGYRSSHELTLIWT